MKLTSTSVIFSFIVIAFISINNYKISQAEDRFYYERYYKKVLEKSTEDASNELKKKAVLDIQGLISEAEIEPSEIFETFFRSFSMNVGLEAEENYLNLSKNFPVLAIIEEDGITLSTYKEYSADGNSYINRIIKNKMKFYHYDNDVMYYPRISGEVTCIYFENGNWIEETGTVEELLNTPLRTKKLNFLEEEDIEKKLKNIISEQISEVISEEIYNHRISLKESQRAIDFFVPGETDDLIKSIKGPTFIAIMQGYKPFDKTGAPKSLSINSISLSRLEIQSSDFFVGFIKNNIKYYTSADNKKYYEGSSVEAFTSEQEAVKSGYFKWIE